MSLTPSFAGRNVLVTGGGRGIGLTIARKFAKAGAKVFLVDNDASLLAQVRQSDPDLLTLEANILEWEETQKKLETIGPIHHLVNNAGVGRPAEPLLDIKPESIDLVFGVNFKGMVNVTQAVARGMISEKLKDATIVNISSISDQVAVPGLCLYSCSKAACTTFTKCSAVELAPHGIRVNCVRPSMVNTEAVGKFSGGSEVPTHVQKINSRGLLGRIVEMGEVADAVLFLSSSSSSMITGSDILLDGGIFTR